MAGRCLCPGGCGRSGCPWWGGSLGCWAARCGPRPDLWSWLRWASRSRWCFWLFGGLFCRGRRRRRLVPDRRWRGGRGRGCCLVRGSWGSGFCLLLWRLLRSCLWVRVLCVRRVVRVFCLLCWRFWLAWCVAALVLGGLLVVAVRGRRCGLRAFCGRSRGFRLPLCRCVRVLRWVVGVWGRGRPRCGLRRGCGGFGCGGLGLVLAASLCLPVRVGVLLLGVGLVVRCCGGRSWGVRCFAGFCRLFCRRWGWGFLVRGRWRRCFRLRVRRGGPLPVRVVGWGPWGGWWRLAGGACC